MDSIFIVDRRQQKKAEMSSSQSIFQLDPSVIKRIAAGEVIHCPSNVVKELFENSLDAGSTRITIEIENGGFSSIKVSDNGPGMGLNDLSIACRRHTTSKIKEFSDLSRISTFGFRGEALFSISCASKLTITSKTEENEVGYKAQYENGELIGDPTPLALTRGTTVEAKELFYNNTNRLRAIPNASQQVRKITQILTKYVIAIPKCAIVLKSEGKEKVRSLGNTTSESVIAMILGGPSIITVKGELGFGASVEMFLGHPSSLRQPKMGCVFVNHRLVKCDRVKKTIRNAYSNFLMKGDSPFFVVLLEISPSKVDVNVHPTKSDVVFVNESEILSKLFDLAIEALEEKSSIREFSSEKPAKEKKQTKIEDNFASEQPVSSEFRDAIESKTFTISKISKSDENYSGISEKVESLQIEKVEKDDPPTFEKVESDFQNNDTQSAGTPEEDEAPQSIKAERRERAKMPTEKDEASEKRALIQKKSYEKMSLFDELKFEPNPGRLTRADPTIRTLEEVISLPENQPLTQPRRTMNLESIKQMKEEIARDCDQNMKNMLRRHVFVGLIDLKFGLVSSDSTLYIVNLFSVTRLLFYQLFVRQIGNCGLLTFSEKLDLRELSKLTTDSSEKVVETMNLHKEMLKDYFNIGVEGDFLSSMPIVLPGYTPSFSALPVFIMRLSTEVDWESEYECISGVIGELSMLYAIQEEDIKSTSEKDRLSAELRTVIFPELKTESFEPSARLSQSSDVRKVRTVQEMYRIFER